MFDIEKKFGAALKVILAVTGTKQKELADMTGIKEQRISDYVTGRRVPSSETMIAIAAELDVSFSDVNELISLIDRMNKGRE